MYKSFGGRARLRRVLCVPLTLAVLALSAGCSGDDSSAGDGSGGSSASSDSAKIVAQAKQKVDELMGDQSFPEPAAGVPAAADKKVFVIPIDYSFSGIHRMTDASIEAVEAIGWTQTMVDGKSSPDTVSSGIDRAISEGADAIILVAVDSGLVTAAVQRARNAGLLIADMVSGSPVGDDGVDVEISSIDYNAAMGAAGAYWAIADSDGKAKAVVFRDTSFTIAPPIADGFVHVMKQCSTCKVEEVVDYTDNNLVTAFPELVRSTMLRHPDADYVYVIADAYAPFAVTGIKDAGSKAVLISTGGDQPSLDLIRNDDVQRATAAEPLAYFSWQAVDGLNRLFGGQKPPPFDAPIKLLVKDNLPPAGEDWDGDTDFRPAFLAGWGK